MPVKGGGEGGGVEHSCQEKPYKYQHIQKPSCLFAHHKACFFLPTISGVALQSI
jgi:hypothetical protein